MNIDPIRVNPNNINNDKSVKSSDKNPESFDNILREVEIKTEIALKCSKLPDPHVLVDPRAIAKMAKDKNFYDKVMSKIDSYTSNQNISLNYPSITYSLVVDADGEWVETMTDEELKKLCEESSKKDKKADPLNDLFGVYNQDALQNNTLENEYSFIDYNNALIDIKKKIRR